MMILSWVLAYTPLSQFFVSYLIAYRNEPFRFLHPIRQKTGISIWIETFERLGLVERKPKGQSMLQSYKQIFKLIGIPCILSLFVDFLAPLLLMHSVIQAAIWLVKTFLQFIPAIVLLLFLQKSILGPLPSPPRRVHLRYPRLGSRIRHLEGKGYD